MKKILISLEKEEIVSESSPFHIFKKLDVEESNQFFPYPVLKQNDTYYLLGNFNNFTHETSEKINCILLKGDESDVYLEWVSYLSSFNLSVVQKVLIIKTLLTLKCSKEFLIHHILSLLNLGNNDLIIRKCLKVSSLPPAILIYSHQKNCSLKQLNYLHAQSSNVVEFYISLANTLPLSFSVVLELIERTQDELKNKDITLDEYLELICINSLLSSESSKQDKVVNLRKSVFAIKYPTLIKKNNEIEQLINTLPSTKQLSIAWDKSLEEKELVLTTKIHSPKDINDLRTFLSKSKIKKTLELILNSL
jgi:hypothetical protein